MNISGVVNNLTDVLNSVNIPALELPSLLLLCTSFVRPGLSPYKIASNVIQNNEMLGIPTGANPDGTDNIINQFTYNIVKEVIESLKNDCSVQVVIPPQSIVVQATGANGGGPVTCIGSNITPSIGKGIIV